MQLVNEIQEYAKWKINFEHDTIFFKQESNKLFGYLLIYRFKNEKKNLNIYLCYFILFLLQNLYEKVLRFVYIK